MWIEERKVRASRANPKFQMCCQDGQVIPEPVHSLPNTIADLLWVNNNASKEFKLNIRTYNLVLSLTSMNADLDQRYANNSETSAYAFLIHGSAHHLMSSTLIPEDNFRPKFAQIYIFDSEENELSNGMNVAGNPNVDLSIRSTFILQSMMHEVNPFVPSFKLSIQELSDEYSGGIQNLRMILRLEGFPDARRCNRPTAPEIDVLIVSGNDGGSNEQPKNRDTVLRSKGPGNDLRRINEMHQHFDRLQYVLL